jgi:hypothetical protein
MGSWHPNGPRTAPQGYRGPPMTLANMRKNGVRSLKVTCNICHHSALINVDDFAESLAVPAFGPRMVCSRCGMIGADARPNWVECGERPSLTGQQWK